MIIICQICEERRKRGGKEEVGSWKKERGSQRGKKKEYEKTRERGRKIKREKMGIIGCYFPEA